MKIAVVGCGIAGATAAWQLAEYGHHVTLFEQAPQCGPVGAGILLQPSGQSVLRKLGLMESVLARSARIHALHAQHRSGRTLVHLEYRRVSEELFGLGVLRSHLFELLFQKCQQANVEIHTGCRIGSYVNSEACVSLLNVDGQAVGEFDLLVAADGSRSRLRDSSGLVRSVHEYPEAALWTTGDCSDLPDRLLQLVDRSGRLVGILPVEPGRCSFFWGLRKEEWPQIQAQGMHHWKQQVAEFHPAAEQIVSHVHSPEDVTFATYRNAQMRNVVAGRVVYIGDAAHATSPHLGQGLNLALEDAVCLADALADTLIDPQNYPQALATYQSARRSATRFYSKLTGFLTPYFQTSNRVLQTGRDLVLPVMPHLPFIGSQMVLTMSGLKTGWLTSRSPNQL